jgi:hypothetical protein
MIGQLSRCNGYAREHTQKYDRSLTLKSSTTPLHKQLVTHEGKKIKKQANPVKNDINTASDTQQCSNIYHNATTTHANKNTPTKLMLQHNPTAKSTSDILPLKKQAHLLYI